MDSPERGMPLKVIETLAEGPDTAETVTLLLVVEAEDRR